MTHSVVVNNIWKQYKLESARKITQALPLLFQKRAGHFWALKGISLQVKPGETLGIIGQNGSGKSTLLKILSRVTYPTRGSIQYDGRIAFLLELGTGFHGELSAKENIYLYGSILGIQNHIIKQNVANILSFAGVERFTDTPLKHYSSGMRMKLAFSIAVYSSPDIFLLDEVMAIGDAQFQNKCISVLQELRKKGCTIIMASHDLGLMQSLSDKMMLLHKGQSLAYGKPKEVINAYQKLILTTADTNISFMIKKAKRFGDGGAEIIDVSIENGAHMKTKTISTKNFYIILKIKFVKAMVSPVPGVIIRNMAGQQITASSTFWKGVKMRTYKKGEILTIAFKFSNIFEVGYYAISANVVYRDLLGIADWQNDVARIFCHKKYRTGSLANPDYWIHILKNHDN